MFLNSRSKLFKLAFQGASTKAARAASFARIIGARQAEAGIELSAAPSVARTILNRIREPH
ncbi:MAG: hypothetical protein ACR2FI_05210 [Burkholderiales bacterium]